MNSMDVRVIGASALTAAVVSVVTVIGVLGLRRECPAPAPVASAVTTPVLVQPPAPAEDEAVVDDTDEVDDSTDQPPVDEEVFGPPGCDAEAAKEKGMGNINMGQHAAALAQFEASLRCVDDPYVRQLAFMESCASGNSVKAKLYYKKLSPAQQTKFAQICIRQKPPVAYE